MKNKVLSTVLQQSFRAAFLGSLLFLLPLVASAQSATDGQTPLGLKPGSPTGSYPLSDFETVSLFNGSLNFQMPLLSIGGRGGTTFPLTIHLDQKWTISKEVNPGHSAYYFAHSSWWSEDDGGNHTISAGRVRIRRGGSDDFYGPDCGDYRYRKTLTRITFVAPDGTEYELRDEATHGQPEVPAACNTGFNRGSTFTTADGSAATFLSDSPIVDAYSFGEDQVAYPANGYLLLRDGTRFKITDDKVMWMRDRNGNKVTFTYDFYKRVTGVTDSLNRQVTITYDNVSGSETYDQISFKGFGGAARTVKVGHGRATRSDISTPSLLFPGLTGVDNSSPTEITYVELPDGRRYQFQYDAYAEIARIVMPTGGAIEYDWANGLTDGDASGLFTLSGDKYVYRRVVERRVYPDGGTGSGYESRMTYSRPESTTTNDGSVLVDQYNSSNVLLAHSQHYFTGSPRDSFGQKATDYPAWQDGKEYKTETYDINGTTLLRKVENTFDQRTTVSWWTGTSATAPPNDVRPTQTVSTLADTNQVSKQIFGYDDTVPFNNQNNVKEYDLGSGAAGSLLRETRTTFVTDSSYTGTSVHLRSLPLTVSVYDGNGALKASSSTEYDNYASSSNCSQSFRCSLVPRSDISGFDSTFDASYITRGNPTSTTRYLITSGAVPNCTTSPSQCLSSYAQYDVAGNMLRSIDARSTQTNIIATTLDYSDHFGAPDADARANSAPSELGGLKTYAFPTIVTNALGQTAYAQFDYFLGKPVNGEDANGVVAAGYYNDLLDRPNQVIRAFNDSATKNQTTFAYNDSARTITATSDQASYSDNLLQSITYYDKMGRTYATRQYEDGTSYITAKTEFDALGRAYRTSNPYRSGDPILWTTSAFDALGRVISVTTPDSAVVATSYSGNTATVTDQNSKARKSVTDGLGRLVQVYEDPSNLNYLTSYSYDTLDNLTTVSQGSQTRSFAYDSLKRLTSATNPESGTIGYTYDPNGNLLTKTDARSVTATYTYDALNRAATRSYGDGTPEVTYSYDSTSITNGKGRLASVSSSVSTYSYNGYDAMGKPTSATETLGSQNYSVAYGYDLAGHVIGMTYPSGRTVSYNYDQAGRLADADSTHPAFKGTLGDGTTRTYSSAINYSAMGGMTVEKFGTDTALYNKLFYNSRGQLSEIRESTTYTSATDTTWNRGAIINYYSNNCWGMCGGSTSSTSMTDNNGNLKKQETYVPNNEANTSDTSWSQQYDYDTLNRLQRVHEYTGNTNTDWQQEYVYDRYGNRTINGATDKTFGNGVNSAQVTVSTATNRMFGPGETDASHTQVDYDAAGNQTKDLTAATGGGTRAYDGENRMTIARDASNNQVAAYTYDADGRRVKRTVGGQPSAVETWQVYGIGGELLAEYAANASPANPQKEYGYRNGQLLITGETPTRANVAAAANGGVATAQNYTQDGVYAGLHFQPSYANDGTRNIHGPSGDHFWRDEHGLSSWVQIDFNGSKSIDEIDVYTIDGSVTQTDPTATQTFSSQGATSYTVQYWNGSAWTTVTGGAVTGNNLVWKKLSFTAVTTAKIRVTVNAAADSVARIAEVEAWGTAGATAATNVAASANGGTATAQNYTQDGVYAGLHFQPSYANDGTRYIHGPGGDQFWRDEHGLASWLQVDFNGTKTINEIDVYTIDGSVTQADPTATQTFSSQGATAYDVQYWNGSAWTTVTGGSVTGNNLVWKKFTFSNITTSKIRVVVNASADSVARIAEVEAWTTPTSAATANINWLVTDQLGTPRMVFDQSGSLATTKRHDYAPFGEELLNGARPNTVGYASGDTTRQKFTQKERDNETGLDYFLARYYSSTQGRFTSADPIFISSQQIVNPQSWNLYNYVNNNPLAYLDPTGMERVRLGQHGDEEIDKLRKEKEQQIKQGKKDGTLTNEQEKTLKAERNTLGLEKEGNKLARGLIDKLPASERSGLQVSDFTLTTDPSGEDFMSDSRFAANAGPDPQGLANAAGTKAMFRIRGYSQEIFINTTTTNIKDMMSGDRDWITYGATLVKHEQSHRDKDYNEFQAYTEQKRVLEHFGAGAFSSPEVYQGHLDFINRNIEKNRPKP